MPLSIKQNQRMDGTDDISKEYTRVPARVT